MVNQQSGRAAGGAKVGLKDTWQWKSAMAIRVGSGGQTYQGVPACEIPGIRYSHERKGPISTERRQQILKGTVNVFMFYTTFVEQ